MNHVSPLHFFLSWINVILTLFHLIWVRNCQIWNNFSTSKTCCDASRKKQSSIKSRWKFFSSFVLYFYILWTNNFANIGFLYYKLKYLIFERTTLLFFTRLTHSAFSSCLVSVVFIACWKNIYELLSWGMWNDSLDM